jgi:hypothetical protein
MPTELIDAKDELDEAKYAIERARHHNGSRINGKRLQTELDDGRELWEVEWYRFKNRNKRQ